MNRKISVGMAVTIVILAMTVTFSITMLKMCIRDRTYTVVLDTPLTEQMRTGFAAGVTLADGTALSPAEVTALSADGLTVRVVLKQGVYHQIKRMFGVYGAGVNGLHRDAIGGLALDPALAPGQWRELSAEEVSKKMCIRDREQAADHIIGGDVAAGSHAHDEHHAGNIGGKVQLLSLIHI